MKDDTGRSYVCPDSKFSNDLEAKNWSQKRNGIRCLSWLDNLLPLGIGYSCKTKKRPISCDFLNNGVFDAQLYIFGVQLPLLSFSLITRYLAFWGKDRSQIFYRDRSTSIAKIIYLLVTEATTLYLPAIIASSIQEHRLKINLGH